MIISYVPCSYIKLRSVVIVKKLVGIVAASVLLSSSLLACKCSMAKCGFHMPNY